MLATRPIDVFIERLKSRVEEVRRRPPSPPQGQASTTIVNTGAEIKRETNLDEQFKLRRTATGVPWTAGDVVHVQRMNGHVSSGTILLQTVEGWPLKEGRWYLVHTDTADVWVHESLIVPGA